MWWIQEPCPGSGNTNKQDVIRVNWQCNVLRIKTPIHYIKEQLVSYHGFELSFSSEIRLYVAKIRCCRYLVTLLFITISWPNCLNSFLIGVFIMAHYLHYWPSQHIWCIWVTHASGIRIVSFPIQDKIAGRNVWTEQNMINAALNPLLCAQHRQKASTEEILYTRPADNKEV